MKSFLIVFTLFLTSYSMAQVSYKDPIAKKQSNISQGHVSDLRKVAEQENKVLNEVEANVEAERKNNTKLKEMDILGVNVKPIPIDLCASFINQNSPKATDCKAKSNYLSRSLLSASKAALLANWMSAVEKQQVLAKYASIINKIQYEVRKMEIDRDKRFSQPYHKFIKKNKLN